MLISKLAFTALAALPLSLQSGPVTGTSDPGSGSENGPDGGLGQGIVALGPECSLSIEELDDLLIWRHGQAPSGKSAQRSLLELKALEHLAQVRGVEVSQSELNARWAELERDIIASGEARDLPQYLLDNKVERATFRRYLLLGMAHEQMVRMDLEVAKDVRIPGETQKVWLEEQLEKLGYKPALFPWTDGVVATIGPLAVTRQELAQELRSKLPDADLADAAYELLLERRLMARMPDLAPGALQGAIETEIARRRRNTNLNPKYKGASYEQLLAAQGLSLETVRRDPAVRSAALSNLWVDRTHDEDGLRAVYEAERPYFDGQFGAGVEVYVCLLNAGLFKNNLIRRTFDEASEELNVLKKGIVNLEQFQERIVPASEDLGTKKAKGLLGLVTRERKAVPAPLREAVFRVLDQEPGDVSGQLVGPVRLQGGVVLGCLGKRQAAPTWASMRHKVHTELRARHLAEVLPRGQVRTLFDPR